MLQESQIVHLNVFYDNKRQTLQNLKHRLRMLSKHIYTAKTKLMKYEDKT